MIVADEMVGVALKDRYEIKRRIARGGSAMVYHAFDHLLHRECAVKVIHDHLAEDAEFRKILTQEAYNAAQLTHSNIVTIYDRSMEDERPYIVMEYVPGTTLRRVIKTKAPLEPLMALKIMEAVLAGLASAHDINLVHLDMKPENVLISPSGEVKVADFGLARAMSGNTCTLNAPGTTVMGTASYIAPEMIMQHPGNTRSDVYSSGVMLYELLTGQKPFTGENANAVVMAHLSNRVPKPSEASDLDWHTDENAIPPYVDELVLAATCREAEERISNARVMLEHVRLAISTLESGIMDDPQVSARMHETELDTAAETSGNLIVEEPTMAFQMSGATNTTTVLASPTMQASLELGTKPETSGKWVHADIPKHLISYSPESPAELEADTAAGTELNSRKSSQTRETGRDFDSAQIHAEFSQPLPPINPIEVVRKTVNQAIAVASPSHKLWAPMLAFMGVCLILGSTGYTGWYLLFGQFTNVPSVIGFSQDQATKAAAEAGTSVTFTTDFSDSVPAGNVIATHPQAGEQMQRSSQFTAVISQGPRLYVVPDLSGLTKDEAVALLTENHLALGTVTTEYSNSVDKNVVISASLSAGTQVQRDTKVNLVVSIGSDQVVVPNTLQMRSEDAKKLLEEAGFKVKVVKEADGGGLDAVSESSPKPTSTAKAGSTVTIKVR